MTKKPSWKKQRFIGAGLGTVMIFVVCQPDLVLSQNSVALQVCRHLEETIQASRMHILRSEAVQMVDLLDCIGQANKARAQKASQASELEKLAADVLKGLDTTYHQQTNNLSRKASVREYSRLAIQFYNSNRHVFIQMISQVQTVDTLQTLTSQLLKDAVDVLAPQAFVAFVTGGGCVFSPFHLIWKGFLVSIFAELTDLMVQRMIKVTQAKSNKVYTPQELLDKCKYTDDDHYRLHHFAMFGVPSVPMHKDLLESHFGNIIQKQYDFVRHSFLQVPHTASLLKVLGSFSQMRKGIDNVQVLVAFSPGKRFSGIYKHTEDFPDDQVVLSVGVESIIELFVDRVPAGSRLLLHDEVEADTVRIIYQCQVCEEHKDFLGEEQILVDQDGASNDVSFSKLMKEYMRKNPNSPSSSYFPKMLASFAGARSQKMQVRGIKGQGKKTKDQGEGEENQKPSRTPSKSRPQEKETKKETKTKRKVQSRSKERKQETSEERKERQASEREKRAAKKREKRITDQSNKEFIEEYHKFKEKMKPKQSEANQKKDQKKKSIAIKTEQSLSEDKGHKNDQLMQEQVPKKKDLKFGTSCSRQNSKLQSSMSEESRDLLEPYQTKRNVELHETGGTAKKTQALVYSDSNEEEKGVSHEKGDDTDVNESKKTLESKALAMNDSQREPVNQNRRFRNEEPDTWLGNTLQHVDAPSFPSQGKHFLGQFEEQINNGSVQRSMGLGQHQGYSNFDTFSNPSYSSSHSQALDRRHRQQAAQGFGNFNQQHQQYPNYGINTFQMTQTPQQSRSFGPRNPSLGMSGLTTQFHNSHMQQQQQQPHFLMSQSPRQQTVDQQSSVLSSQQQQPFYQQSHNLADQLGGSLQPQRIQQLHSVVAGMMGIQMQNQFGGLMQQNPAQQQQVTPSGFQQPNYGSQQFHLMQNASMGQHQRDAQLQDTFSRMNEAFVSQANIVMQDKDEEEILLFNDEQEEVSQRYQFDLPRRENFMPKQPQKLFVKNDGFAPHINRVAPKNKPFHVAGKMGLVSLNNFLQNRPRDDPDLQELQKNANKTMAWSMLSSMQKKSGLYEDVYRRNLSNSSQLLSEEDALEKVKALEKDIARGQYDTIVNALEQKTKKGFNDWKKAVEASQRGATNSIKTRSQSFTHEDFTKSIYQDDFGSPNQDAASLKTSFRTPEFKLPTEKQEEFVQSRNVCGLHAINNLNSNLVVKSPAQFATLYNSKRKTRQSELDADLFGQNGQPITHGMKVGLTYQNGMVQIVALNLEAEFGISEAGTLTRNPMLLFAELAKRRIPRGLLLIQGNESEVQGDSTHALVLVYNSGAAHEKSPYKCYDSDTDPLDDPDKIKNHLINVVRMDECSSVQLFSAIVIGPFSPPQLKKAHSRTKEQDDKARAAINALNEKLSKSGCKVEIDDQLVINLIRDTRQVKLQTTDRFVGNYPYARLKAYAETIIEVADHDQEWQRINFGEHLFQDVHEILNAVKESVPIQEARKVIKIQQFVDTDNDNDNDNDMDVSSVDCDDLPATQRKFSALGTAKK